MGRKFTGICVCGHSFDDHHHSMVLNPKALEELGVLYKMVNGVIGGECEATQFEGMTIDGSIPCVGIIDDQYPYCISYKDKGWTQ